LTRYNAVSRRSPEVLEPLIYVSTLPGLVKQRCRAPGIDVISVVLSFYCRVSVGALACEDGFGLHSKSSRTAAAWFIFGL